MGLFGKKDELFEIMARGSARKQAGEPTSQAVARQSERASPALKQPKTSGAWPKASGAWPKPNRSSRSWRRGGEPAAEELFLEVDGDAIVLVDDGFVDGLEAEDGPEVPTFAIRTDTAVVGGILACSLLAAAFFMGRTTTAPTGPAVTGPGEVAVVVRPPTPEPAPAPEAAPQQVTPTAVPASFRPEQAVSQAAPQQAPDAAAQPAEEPAAAEPTPTPAKPIGNYFLNVCTTTQEKGEKLAQWLNEAPRSPIFGREGLAGEVTSRGTVRIRGFTERDGDVLKRVRATSDPTGGSGTFSDAYFRRAR